MKHRPSGTASGAEQEFRVFVQGIATPLRREIAATKYAVTGNLKEARKRMASAPSPSTKVKDIGPGVVPSAGDYAGLSSEVVRGAQVTSPTTGSGPTRWTL
jgi:hypothetical protein